MRNIYRDLCQRIIAHCQQQHYFAADYHKSALLHPEPRYEWSYDAEGNEVVYDHGPQDLSFKEKFAYPPATVEQIFQTEKQLRFSLPPVLKAIYAQVANGGFGPGYGLIGIPGGFCEAGDIVDNYFFHVRRCQLIALNDYLQPDGTVELPESLWPSHMIYLCDWGRGTISCLDCQSDKIYVRLSPNDKGIYRFELQAPSLFIWFGWWLKGAPIYEHLPLIQENRDWMPDVTEAQPDMTEVRLFFSSVDSTSLDTHEDAEEL